MTSLRRRASRAVAISVLQLVVGISRAEKPLSTANLEHSFPICFERWFGMPIANPTKDSKRVGLRILLRSSPTRDIEIGILFRPQGIIHAFSRHFITEWPNSRGFRPFHIVFWKDILMKHSLLRLVFISLLAAQAAPHGAWAQVKAAPPLSGVKGKLQSFTGSSLDDPDTVRRSPRQHQAAPHNL